MSICSRCILAELLDAGQLRVDELSKSMGYKKLTVRDALGELHAQGCLTKESIDARPGKSGRTMRYGLTKKGIELALQQHKEDDHG